MLCRSLRSRLCGGGGLRNHRVSRPSSLHLIRCASIDVVAAAPSETVSDFTNVEISDVVQHYNRNAVRPATDAPSATASDFSSSQLFDAVNAANHAADRASDTTSVAVADVNAASGAADCPTEVAAVQPVPDVVDCVNQSWSEAGAVLDPAFVEMGLAGGWMPHNLIQAALEAINVSAGWPWWATIAASTFAVRALITPWFVYVRKHAVLLHNHMPEQQEILKEVREVNQDGSFTEQMLARQKMTEFTKRTGVGPIRSLLINVPMPIIFLSFMTSLRQMVNVPVPSLDAASLLWVDSLCAGDPFRLLPILSGLTVGASLHLSLKFGSVAGQNQLLLRYGKYFPFIPIIAMPLMLGHWAGAIQIYILCNSLITAGTSGLLLVPAVQNYLNFPQRVDHSATAGGAGKSSFAQQWRELTERTRKRGQAKAVEREVRRAAKRDAKARKKELKGRPPVTYEIGVEAVARRHVPDFEREWRPPLPGRRT